MESVSFSPWRNLWSTIQTRPFTTILYKTAFFIGLLFIGHVISDRMDQASLAYSLWILLLAYLGLNVFFTFTRALITSGYRRKNHYSYEHVDNFIIGIRNIVFFLNHAIFLLVLIHVLFVDIITFLTSISIALAFIAIVFREFITNFINGLILMFSGNFRLREYVKLGDHRGRIINITFSNVELLTDSRDVVFVPNNIVMGKESINFSKNRVKNIFVDFTVDKAYFSHHGAIAKKLTKLVLKEFSHLVSDEDRILVYMDSLGKDNVHWTVEFMTNEYSFAIEKELRDFTLSAIVDVINSIDKAKKKEAQKHKEKKRTNEGDKKMTEGTEKVA